MSNVKAEDDDFDLYGGADEEIDTPAPSQPAAPAWNANTNSSAAPVVNAPTGPRNNSGLPTGPSAERDGGMYGGGGMGMGMGMGAGAGSGSGQDSVLLSELNWVSQHAVGTTEYSSTDSGSPKKLRCFAGLRILAHLPAIDADSSCLLLQQISSGPLCSPPLHSLSPSHPFHFLSLSPPFAITVDLRRRSQSCSSRHWSQHRRFRRDFFGT